jgi:hypothetical protein
MVNNSENAFSISSKGLDAQLEVVYYPYSTFAGVCVDIKRIIYENSLFVRDPTTLTTFTGSSRTHSNCILLDFSNVCTALFRLNRQISKESLEYFYTKNHFVNVLTNPTLAGQDTLMHAVPVKFYLAVVQLQNSAMLRVNLECLVEGFLDG